MYKQDSLYRVDSFCFVSQQNKDNSQIKIRNIWNLTEIFHVVGQIWLQCNTTSRDVGVIFYLSISFSHFNTKKSLSTPLKCLEMVKLIFQKTPWVEEIFS